MDCELRINDKRGGLVCGMKRDTGFGIRETAPIAGRSLPGIVVFSGKARLLGAVVILGRGGWAYKNGGECDTLGNGHS